MYIYEFTDYVMSILWVPVWNSSRHHKSDLAAPEGGGATRTDVSMKGAALVAPRVSLLNQSQARKASHLGSGTKRTAAMLCSPVIAAEK